MATLGDLRATLTRVLDEGLYAVNVYPWPQDKISGPAVTIAGFSIDPTTSDGRTVVVAELWVEVAKASELAFPDLDRLVDIGEPESVWSVLNANPSLDDTVPYVVVTRVGEYRATTYGASTFYAANVILEIGL